MPRIGRFPPFGKRFFRRARKILGSCHFAHFWRAVMALAAMQGRRSLKGLEAACRNHHSRQSIGFFLNKAHWDAPQLLADTALDMLKSLGYRPGQTVGLIFDDTQKKKRAKQMDAVSKIFLHAEKVYAQGHTILGCAIVYRGVVIPYAVRLWVPKSFALATQQESYEGERLEYRKLTELVAEIINDFPLPKATVLFDAYYLCSLVARAIGLGPRAHHKMRGPTARPFAQLLPHSSLIIHHSQIINQAGDSRARTG